MNTCDRCDSRSEDGIHASTNPWEFICGECCDELLDRVEEKTVADHHIIEAYRSEVTA